MGMDDVASATAEIVGLAYWHLMLVDDLGVAERNVEDLCRALWAALDEVFDSGPLVHRDEPATWMPVG